QTVRVGEVLVTFADAAPAGKDAADTLDPTRTLAPSPTAPKSVAAASPGLAPSMPASSTPAPPPFDERRGPVPAAPSTRRLASAPESRSSRPSSVAISRRDARAA